MKEITSYTTAGIQFKNKCRGFIYRTLLIAHSSWLIAFFSCENNEKTLDDLTKKVVLKEEATNVESMLSQDGKIKAKLIAPLMVRVFGDTLYAEFPNSLHCDFYNDGSTVETRLDSRYGKYYEGIGKVFLRDSVVVITVKGDTLLSPDLWWDQNSKLFYTDKYAIYKGIGKNIHGRYGLTATQDLNSVIFNQPTGRVQVTEGGIPGSQ